MLNRIVVLAAVALGLTLLSCSRPQPASAKSSASRRTRQEIVGGSTEPAHWYVVMVGGDAGGFCSGTLISKRTVITAGHCWGTGVDAITQVYFESGKPLLNTKIAVLSSVRHPGYDDVSLTHDLALVQLASDAPVQAAPLLRETMDSTFVGPKFSFVGYGDINATGVGFGTRRVVTYPIDKIGPVASIVVPSTAPPGASNSIDATQFYYQLPYKNTCSGDSGGPAFVLRNGVERHAGTTSFGDDDCAYDGVQSRTDATTLDWIQQTIDAFEPNGPCRADGICGTGCTSTMPAPLGTLEDPDCADAHCTSDGVCVLSCSPVDPDCATLTIDNCADNGICQPGCATPDVDCPTVPQPNGASCTSGASCESGFCTSNVCCNRACTGGCESCAAALGASANGTCTLRTAGLTCRPSAGACDVAESCDGMSGACPADALSSATMVCRASSGVCDAAELCSGSTATCPLNAVAADGTACPTGHCALGVCVANAGTGGGAGGSGGGGGASPKGCGCGTTASPTFALWLLALVLAIRLGRRAHPHATRR